MKRELRDRKTEKYSKTDLRQKSEKQGGENKLAGGQGFEPR